MLRKIVFTAALVLLVYTGNAVSGEIAGERDAVSP
jgi:hypothetical protein